MRWFVALAALQLCALTSAYATTFTTTVPGTSITIPTTYPQAGGVVIVLEGANGNVYYQFSNPSTMYQGYNNSGTPAAWQGNPMQIAPATTISCGLQSCATYFGGSIARVSVRFTAYDGDTKSGDFDFNKITLNLNGTSVGNFSVIATQTTNTAGTTLVASGTGFGNNTYDTGWFQSTNATLLGNILSTGGLKSTLTDTTPNDNYWDFKQGSDATAGTPPIVAPGVTLKKTSPQTTFAAVGDVISYSYVMQNIGSVWINPLRVSDNKIATVSCGAPSPAPSLSPATAGQVDPGATVNCTASYVVTQADVDAGRITNIATATGTPQYGSLGPLTDTVTITGPTANPSVQLTKKATPSPFGAVGSTTTYTFDVKNTGNVTLSSVAITDPLLASLSCTTPSIAPNTTVTATCTGNTRTITQANVDAASVTNTATVTAKSPAGTTVTANSSITLTGPTRTGGIALVKTAGTIADTNGNGVQDAGDTLSYTFKVTNSGNVTLTNITVTDPKATMAGGPLASLLPGISDTSTFTATYVLQQADFNTGSVSNQATATGTTPSGVTGPVTDLSDPASNTANALTVKALTQTRSLSLTKSTATTSYSASGVSITYSYAVKNTGNVTLTTAVTVTDNKIASVNCGTFPPAGLVPGATQNCTGTYTTTLTDVNNGSVTNTATAASGATTSNSANVTVPATLSPSVALVKAIGTIADTNSSSRQDAGDTVTYQFTVTNTGNVTLTNLNVSDPLSGITISGGPIASLNPGTSSTAITATYVLKQADVTAGQVTNQATATGTPPTGPNVTDLSDPASATGSAKTVTPITQVPSVAIIKAPGTIDDFNGNGKTDAGDRLSYAITVTNTGNVPLTSVAVTDPKTGVTVSGSPIATLAPAAVNTSVTATYILTQADIDAGVVTNQAKVSGTPPTGPPATDQSDPASNAGNTTTSTVIPQTSSIAIIKTAGTPTKTLGTDATITDANDTITYTFQIKNTGTTTLTGVGVTDPKISNACATVTLAPGATATCTSNAYAISQPDMDAGSVSNQATATGTKPLGGTVSDLSDPASFASGASTVVPLTQTPKIAVTKSGATPTIANGTDPTATDVGDTVTYSFVVKNTGSVRLSSVALSDPKLTGLSCLASTLAVTATTTCTANAYVLTQADVDVGYVDNQATATGLSPLGVSVSDLSDSSSFTANSPTRVTFVQKSGIALIKAAGAIQDFNNNGLQDAGDRITYSFTVTNTGVVTLTNITVSDPGLAVSGGTLTTLAAGGSNSSKFTAIKTLTQADIDAGHFDNQATVSAVAPTGPITDLSDPASTAGNAPTVVTIAPNAKLLLSKSSTVPSFAAVGDVISYTYDVKNIGNITIVNSGATAITVTDDKTTVSCPATPASLSPQATIQCTASYTVTQTDIDAGKVINTATAKTGAATSAPDSVTVPAIQQPKLDVLKEAPVVNFGNVGDLITYKYTVSNTGNTTVNGPFTVNDNRIGSFTCFAGDLAPGQSDSCTANYNIILDDLKLGSVTNLATASGSGVTSDIASIKVPPLANPALSIQKTVETPAPPGTFAQVGDRITYVFDVENSGTVGLVNLINIVDDKIGTITCYDPAASGVFAPGNTARCRADYTVQQADLDAGFAKNQAYGSTTFGATNIPVASQPAVANVDAAMTPSLNVAKQAALFNDLNGNGNIDAGDTVKYTITVSNTGNQTVSNIDVSDPLLPALACSIPSLAPLDAPQSCSDNYTATQADIDLGVINNTASAAGVNPQGRDVRASDSLVTPVAPDNAKLTISKIASPDPIDAIGQAVTYFFTVSNTGNLTLTNVTVTDILSPTYSCVIPELLPGDTNSTTCKMTYVATQADIDAGGVVNTANVTATAPRGPNPTATTTITTPGPAREPAMILNKVVTAGPTIMAAGGTIDYQFVLSNTGNVTIASPSVTDAKCASGPSFQSGDTDGDGKLSVNEIFIYACTSIAITQAEVDAGTADNTANATGVPAGGTLAPASAAVSTPITPAPLLDVVKTADVSALSSPPKAGEVVTYTITAKNNGNVTLNTVTITDTLANEAGATLALTTGPTLQGASDTGADGKISPSEKWSYTATYTLTQADVDSGGLKNQATVGAKTPAGVGVSDQSGPATGTDATTNTPFAASGGLDVVKTANVSALSTPPKAGETITYAITAKNTGNVTLNTVTIADTLKNDSGTALSLTSGPTLVAASDTGADSRISPNEQWSYTATYQLTQADIDSGGVKNRATVDARTPAGAAVSDPSGPTTGTDATTDTPLAASGALDVIKLADVSALSTPPKAGDVISYTITAKNTGNVTLNTVTISDTLKNDAGATLTLTTGPTLTAATDVGTDNKLTPGEQWTYTASYALTQSDIDAGGVKNQATVDAKTPAGATVSDPSGPSTGTDATTDTSFAPVGSLDVIKTANATALSNPPRPGQKVSYTITAKNTGNVTLTNVTITDTLTDAGGTAISPSPVPVLTPASDTGSDSKISPDETWTYTFDYTITQADIDAGGLKNQATVAGDTPKGVNVSDLSGPTTGTDITTDTSFPSVGTLDVIKLANATGLSAPPKPGDVISYTITAKNTGNVTLNTVTITDTLTDAGGAPITPAPTPVLDGSTDTGSDSKLSPGETWTYTTSYTLSQAAIDAGGVKNQATVNAKKPDGSSVTDQSGPSTGTDATTNTTFAAAGALDVIKTADATAVSSPPVPGDVISYTITAENRGNVTLSTVTITDTLKDASGAGLTLTAGPTLVASSDAGADSKLSPAETWTYTASYAITQSDIDSGAVNNSATVTAKTPAGLSVSDDSGPTTGTDAAVITTLASAPALDIVKTADTSALSTPPKAGETVSYTVTAKNTGNVTLNTVTITDTLKNNAGATLFLTSGPTLDAVTDTGADAKLSPAEQWTYQATYTITQADIDSGGLKNQAKVAAKTPSGTAVSDDSGPATATDATTDTPLAASGLLDVVKTADTSAFSTPPQPGDVVTYTITAENKGNVTLATVTIADTLTNNAGASLTLTTAPALDAATDTGSDSKLSPAEIWTYTATYKLTQADIDAGGLKNQATVDAKTPAGAAVTDNSGPTTGTDATTDTTIGAAGALDVIKTADASALSNPPVPGEKVTYTITAKNTGNVTLSNIAISDTLTDKAGNVITPAPAPTLVAASDIGADSKISPNETWSFTFAHTLTQADVDAGGLKNKASVSGDTPAGITVTDQSGPTTGTDATTDTPFTGVGTLDVIKTANVSGLSTPPKPGDVVSYTITARNTGNVTLDTVTITDTLTNNAGTVLALTSGPSFDAATDTGSDSKLSPAETWTYAATYALTQADIDAGGIKNQATVTAKKPDGSAAADSSGPSTGTDATTNTSFTSSGALDTIKTADTTALSSPPKPGDVITYTITTKNTGNVTLNTVTIVDTLTDNAGNGLTLTSGPTLDTATDTGADSKLSPAEQWSYMATYAITQSDIDAGGVKNTATVNAKTPAGASVSDVSGPLTGTDGTTDSALAVAGALDVIKIADISALSTPPKPGDVISYTITAQNTGNGTLNTVTITDSLTNNAGAVLTLTSGPTLDTATDTGGDGKLTPAEQWTYTATYALTQADIDAGGVKNQATAQAKTPAGVDVTDASGPSTGTDATTNVTFTEAGALDVIKTADVSGLSNPPVAGETVKYTITSTNTGNVTLGSVTITDTLVNGDGATLALTSGPTLTAASDVGGDGKLSPNEQWTYLATYKLTQADVDSAGLKNQATVKAKTPANADVQDLSGPTTGTDQTTDSIVGPIGSLDVVKTADNAPTAPPKAGDVVSFTITARNTGNVTLSTVTITDKLATKSGTPITPDPVPTLTAASDTGGDGKISPNETWSYTVSHTLTQADIDAGGIKNQATVQAQMPDGTQVTDLSGPSAGTDNATDVPFASAPSLDVIKTANLSKLSKPPKAEDVIGYTITAKNIGNVTLSNVTISDTLVDAKGAAVTPGPVPALVAASDAGADSLLSPNETWTYKADYALTQANLDAGGVKNSATVSGTGPDGLTLSDVSGPGTGTNASTDFLITKATVSGTVFFDQNGNGKLDGDPPAGAGYIVELVDSTGKVVGTTKTDANGRYSIPATPGAGYTLVFRNPAGGELGRIANLTLGVGTNVVNQNQPIDPSGVVYNSVTREPVAGVTVTITDNSGNPLPSACILAGQQNQVTNATGGYRFDIVPGAAAQCPVGPTTYLIKISNPNGFNPGFSVVIPPQSGAVNASTCPVDAIPGGKCEISASFNPPPVGTSGVYYTAVILGVGAADVIHNHLPIDPNVSSLTKTANVRTARIGEQVTFTIEAVGVAMNPARLVDILPPGLTFVPGSATSNGKSVKAKVNVNTLTFDGLVPAKGKLKLVLRAVVNVAAKPGKLVNRATLIDPATGTVYGTASAAITIISEHVFDCSDIIGKVFEDSNRNGYQDEGEPGLPGVRLATVNGQLITTDAHGRYHVGCAAIPDAAIGSNFILKLDTRTLPSGYRVTTENPRMVRVTRGKVVKLNFGASIARIVNLDVNGNVFNVGEDTLKEKWLGGLSQLIESLEKGPSVLRITYYRGIETMPLAQARLQAVQRAVERLWDASSGKYKLPVESRLVGADKRPPK